MSDPAQPEGAGGDDTARVAVEKWLNKEGYPLEYRTYAALWRRFLGNSGLGMYVQSKEGEPREIDAYAQLTHVDLSKSVGFLLRVVIECKYSRDKPWVLLYGNPDRTWFVDAWLRTPRSGALEALRTTQEGFSEDLADEISKSFHFRKDVPLAHNIVQAHVSGANERRDRAYDSLRKICHAAWDSLGLVERGQTTWHAMLFPSLVVDGPLFAASYDAKVDRVQAKHIKYGRVCWRGAYHGTYVDVVRAEALDEYAEHLSESFATIMRVLRAVYEDAPGNPEGSSQRSLTP